MSLNRSSIISHRGASGYLPEHSLAAYRLAIDLGTDYIEPDLVLSRDGIFFALHDILLDNTTNIIEFPQFKNRLQTRLVDGEVVTGYFVNDFSSTELKSLRVKQRLPNSRSNLTDSLFEIPTLEAIFELVEFIKYQKKRTIGLYIELKHPGYYRSLEYSMTDLLLNALSTAGFAVTGCESSLVHRADPLPVVIQCFEAETLVALRSKCDLPLVQLCTLVANETVEDVWTDSNLQSVAQYANGLGPPTWFFTDPHTDRQTAVAMMDRAHYYNLAVHPWTIREEAQYVDKQFNGSSELESLFFLCCLRVDGIFTEFPDRTRQYMSQALKDPSVCASRCPEPLYKGKMTTELWGSKGFASGGITLLIGIFIILCLIS